VTVATKIKYIPAHDFIEVTADGVMDIASSTKLLIDIAKAEQQPVDHELLIDFRDTESKLSITDIYQLASKLCEYDDAFKGKVSLLMQPGLNFDRAKFFETCTHNRGYSIYAFTEYEKAMRWILSTDEAGKGPIA
jgi:hypothetical protein